MLRLLIFFVLLLLPSISEATTYYVKTTGSDSNTCVQAQSALTPKLTVPAGVSCLAGGDTLIVGAGTYTRTGSGVGMINNPPAGTASAYTIIKADPAGARPVFSLQHNAGGTYQFGFLCTNGSSCHHIEVRGFEFADAYAGVYLQGTDALGYPDSIRLIDNVIHDTLYEGFLGYSNAAGTLGGNHLIQGNEFYNIGIYNSGYTSGVNTIYGPGNNVTIERNSFHDSRHGIGIWYSGKTIKNAIIRYNLFYHMGRMDVDTWQQGSDGQRNSNAIHLSVPGGGHLVHNNLFYTNGAAGIANNFKAVRIGTQANSTTTAQIYNNTIYNSLNLESANTTSCLGAIVNCTTSVVQIRNNIAYLAGASPIAGKAGTTISNTLTANPSFTNAAGGDFSLTASSSNAIDQGYNTGVLPYNGSAPDIGAFETFTFAACSVANATATVINATFTNNVFPPLLPSTGVTTFTARKATVNDVVTGVVRTGDNQLDITVTNAFVAGNAIDISWASGNLTDSAYIGGTMNQPFLPITNQACTNNVGAAPSHLFIQAAFEFHGLRGTEAAPVILPYGAAAENTNINVVVGGKARLRFAMTCTTADCPPTGFFLYYSKDGGAYAVVPDTFGADNIAFCGTNSDPDIPTSGYATTDQLSTSGTFVAAALVRTSNAIPTIDLAQNNKTEPEYCVAWDTDTTADATYDFRIYKQDATAIDTYTVTPRATVRAMSAGMGF